MIRTKLPSFYHLPARLEEITTPEVLFNIESTWVLPLVVPPGEETDPINWAGGQERFEGNLLSVRGSDGLAVGVSSIGPTSLKDVSSLFTKILSTLELGVQERTSLVSGDIRVEVWVAVNGNNIKYRAEDLVVLLNDVKRLRGGDWSRVSIILKSLLDFANVASELRSLAETLEDSLVTNDKHLNEIPWRMINDCLHVTISTARSITDEDTEDDLHVVSLTSGNDAVKGTAVRRV